MKPPVSDHPKFPAVGARFCVRQAASARSGRQQRRMYFVHFEVREDGPHWIGGVKATPATLLAVEKHYYDARAK